ncbi:MAG: hypothetical protein WDW38_003060 [Sanguina aurantia]
MHGTAQQHCLVVEDLLMCSDTQHVGSGGKDWVPLRLVWAAPDKRSSSSSSSRQHGSHASGSSSGGGSSGGGGSDRAGEPNRPGLDPPVQPVRLPVVIFLHPTGANMSSEHHKQESYAAAGYLAAAIDCHHHGERCAAQDFFGGASRGVYNDALVRAWRTGPERPFLLDNVWDIVALLDYLETRPDVDMARIGITGTSLGGMHSWLAAVVDSRISVIAPTIGVQCFKWAVDHDRFQGRVSSIQPLFDAAAADMQKRTVDAAVVQAVWRKLMPGLLDHYDAPMSLPSLAPRPLLIANGELDDRCPMEGLQEALRLTQAEYERVIREQQPSLSEQELSTAVAGRFQLYVEKFSGHRETSGMNSAVRQFMDKHLLNAGL